MNMRKIVRLRMASMWMAAALVLPLAQAQSAAKTMTAQEAIDKILAATGVSKIDGTVDTVKAGDPNTPVTGILTTFMDTYEVLQKAVAENKNLIVTHEPTFYNHLDNKSIVGESDPVLAEKLAYIQEHHLVVWRFHDAWHKREPDGILEGVIDELGWKSYQSSANPHLFVVPAATLSQLAESLRVKTGSHVIWIVGNPKLAVTQVALLPGASGLSAQVKALQRDDVQVLVGGEASQWETVEYARDAAAQGKKKALILLGHEPSEEAGMKYCAEWLKGIFPGMPIAFVPAGQPMWTLESAGK